MSLRALAALLLLALSGCSHLVWYGRSDDRRHIVAVLEEGGRQRVRFDLKDGPTFRGVGVDALVVTNDGHLVYPAQLPSPLWGEGQGEGWTVVVDGQATPRVDAIGELRLSGAQLAWTAERAGKWVVMSLELSKPGVRTGEPFDEILAGSLTLTTSGRLAYAARRGDDVLAIIDGSPSAAFDGIGQLTFSEDGRRVGYVARRAGFQHVVIDGAQSEPFEQLSELRLGPPDVFIARKDGGWRVFTDGRAGEPYERIAGLLVSGGQVAYGGRRGTEHFVIDGARTWGPYAQMRSLLARDAQGRLVFAAQKGAEQVVVFGDRELSGGWDDVQVPVVSGAHVGFIARRGDEVLVMVDGEPRSRWASAEGLALSEDGTRVAHLAHVGGRPVLVLDGTARPVDVVVSGTLAFSKDGRRFGYVSGERKKKRLFIERDDGRRVPVDLEELVAALTRLPPESLITSPDVTLLRRWVEAELAR